MRVDPPLAGLLGARTLVLVRNSGMCSDGKLEHTGIVFDDHEPVGWTCITEAEIPGFQSWGKQTYPGALWLTIDGPLENINCPPPPTNGPVPAERVDEIRAELRRLAESWFPLQVTLRSTQVA
jgi:hypothetical protein